MQVVDTEIPEVKILIPMVFGDDRGFFFESYNQRSVKEAGINQTFVQDNHSRSIKNTLRGIHYQIQNPQGKLVRVTQGSVYDVAVDLRKKSPTFGQWAAVELSADNHKMLWVPAGFGHAFLVTSDSAEFLYKTTDFYSPADERCIAWNDPTLNISWPINGSPLVSKKDEVGTPFNKAEVYSSPVL
ncbi:dTDP-4-dehydrorhamnose 3,5-epimerase [Chlamydiales bacterium SCGC AG-110-P3]|nr:dTDP-4-dehydrorhamnose 3,5-epimerase [Chlamydiales bacterium SCGC AG-110-P3]